MSVSFFKRKDAPDIAYQKMTGENTSLPTIVFFTGFRSDMQGTKAAFLADGCESRGQSCVLFDYRGHGQSGGVFEEGTIGLWLADALDVIDNLTQGPLIVVGSSMGGWIALRTAVLRKERVAGLIGLAAAPDFTRELPARLSPDQKLKLERDGFFSEPTEYDERPLIITKKLLEEGESHCMLDAPIPIECPVRLIQGMKDADVPWQTAHRISNALTGKDKKVYLREEGDHRLSTPEDLELLEKLVLELSGG